MNASTRAQTPPPPGASRTLERRGRCVGGSAIAVVLDPAKHESPVPSLSSQQERGTGKSASGHVPAAGAVRFPSDDPNDQQRRYAAGQIQRRHPRWLVMYGPHSRKIWAYPAFSVPVGLYFGEENPSELESRMSETEMTYLRRMP